MGLLPPRDEPPSTGSLMASLSSVGKQMSVPAALMGEVRETWTLLSRTLALPPSAVPLSGKQWDLLATAILAALGHKRLAAGLGGITKEDSTEMKVCGALVT